MTPRRSEECWLCGQSCQPRRVSGPSFVDEFQKSFFFFEDACRASVRSRDEPGAAERPCKKSRWVSRIEEFFHLSFRTCLVEPCDQQQKRPVTPPSAGCSGSEPTLASPTRLLPSPQSSELFQSSPACPRRGEAQTTVQAHCGSPESFH